MLIRCVGRDPLSQAVHAGLAKTDQARTWEYLSTNFSAANRALFSVFRKPELAEFKFHFDGRGDRVVSLIVNVEGGNYL